MTKTVAVTGGGGYVASELIHQLLVSAVCPMGQGLAPPAPCHHRPPATWRHQTAAGRSCIPTLSPLCAAGQGLLCQSHCAQQER